MADSDYITGSFLQRTIDTFREQTDEPAVNEKYSDSRLIEKVREVYSVIIGEINRTRSAPVVGRVTVTVASGTTSYVLPATVGSIFSVYEESSNGTRVFYDSRGRYNSAGRGVWIEGSTLYLQSGSCLAAGTELTVEFLPNGTPRLHVGKCTVDSTGKLVTLGSVVANAGSTSLGSKDTRLNAYVGCTFRLLRSDDSDYDFEQERKITAYDNGADSATIVTLDTALSPNPEDTGTTYYEIAPAIHQGLDHVIGVYLAWWVANSEGMLRRASGLHKVYTQSMRALRLEMYSSVLGDGMRMMSDGYDNTYVKRTRRWRH